FGPRVPACQRLLVAHVQIGHRLSVTLLGQDEGDVVVNGELKHATDRISSRWRSEGQVVRRPRRGGGIGTAAPPTCHDDNLQSRLGALGTSYESALQYLS